MARYRKKPVEIEAVQWDGNEATFDLVMGWSADEDRTFSMSQGNLYIATLEGEMRADPGDWIIRGVEGEVYPCKPSVFTATYDPV